MTPASGQMAAVFAMIQAMMNIATGTVAQVEALKTIILDAHPEARERLESLVQQEKENLRTSIETIQKQLEVLISSDPKLVQ